MGMDVYGKKPISEEGEYFRANIWSWHPIWDYCHDLMPEICSKVENAHSNDGDGLEADDARTVGEAVLMSITNGSAQKFLMEREEFFSAIPDVPCVHCYGTGRRQWFRNIATGSQRNKWEYDFMQSPTTVDELKPRTANEIAEGEIEIDVECNSCHGKGTERPWVTNYGFDLDHLQEFGKFMVASGGFSIC